MAATPWLTERHGYDPTSEEECISLVMAQKARKRRKTHIDFHGKM